MLVHFVWKLKCEVLLGLVALWSVLVVFVLLVKSAPHSVTMQLPEPEERRHFVDTTQYSHTIELDDASATPAHQAELQVVMGCDGSALGGLVAAINSAAANTDTKLHFYLATNKEEASHLKTWLVSTRLHQLVYTLREVRGDVRRVKVDFAQVFPEIDGMMVFLECDVILKGDLAEIFKTPLAANQLGAFVTDCSKSAETGHRDKYSAHVNIYNTRLRVKLDAQRCPFNTGVFLVNASNWRVKDVAGKLHYWLDIHRRQPITALQNTADDIEAAMLIELYNKTSEMDPLWNVGHLGSNNGPHSKQYLDTAKLIHWSGSWKPWKNRTPLAELWDKYFVPDPTGQFRPIRKRGFAKANENSRGF